jgi:hypothetical protein
MRLLIAILVSSALCASCTKKASLTDDEERYVQITLAILKARATTAQSTDSLQLGRTLDSVYKAFETDSADYVRMSVELADKPDHALLAYQTIRDSLGLK